MRKKQIKTEEEEEEREVASQFLYVPFSSSIIVLDVLCVISKAFFNQSSFLVVAMLPIITPTMNPNPYPTKSIFHPNSKRNPGESRVRLKTAGEESKSQHFFGNGYPHKPKFPSKEIVSNVLNCFPSSIELVR